MKKTVRIIIFFICISLVLPLMTAFADSYYNITCDVKKDGVVDVNDALMIQSIINANK